MTFKDSKACDLAEVPSIALDLDSTRHQTNDLEFWDADLAIWCPGGVCVNLATNGPALIVHVRETFCAHFGAELRLVEANTGGTPGERMKEYADSKLALDKAATRAPREGHVHVVFYYDVSLDWPSLAANH